MEPIEKIRGGHRKIPVPELYVHIAAVLIKRGSRTPVKPWLR